MEENIISIDIHDRVMEAYYGKLGEALMHDTQARIHWVGKQVVGSKILDVGCSQGISSILLAREGKFITALDTSEKAIEEAKLYAHKEQPHVQKRIHFVHDDFMTHDFKDEKFDTIIIAEVLEHLVNPKSFIERASVLLNDGGRIIVTVPFGINDFIDHKQTFYMLEPFLMLSSYFHVEKFTILGKWIGFYGTLNTQQDNNFKIDESFVEELEKAFYKTERDLVDVSVKLRTQLNSANEKYKNATQQIDTLKKQNEDTTKKNSTCVQQVESQKEQLSNANEKYRTATQQIDTLKSNIESLNKKNSELNEQNVIVIQQIELLKNQLSETQINTQKYRDIILEKEKETISLQNQIEKTKEQLSNANEKYRTATQQIETFKVNIESLNKKNSELNEQNVIVIQQTDALKSNIESLDHKNSQLNEQNVIILQQIELQTSQLQESETSAQNYKNTILENEKHLSALKDEILEIRGQLSGVNLKYRHQVNEVVPYLKNEIEKLKFQSKQNLSNANHDMEQLRHKVATAQQQVVQVRSTLSFQIGYQIVHAFQPWYNIFLLPKKIWQIKQKHKKKSLSAISQVAQIKDTQANKQTLHTFKTLDTNLQKMKIACVMDEFTYTSYKPECNLMQLTPHNYEAELEEFAPELLFIESAWRGGDDLWGNKIGHNSVELQGIISYCKQNNIPTLFWNKEDPVHFETFLNTAQQFDYVFTTDMDCIHRYKGALGLDRVYLLPFATQPKAHNPIEKYERKDAFCFAGAYYVRYPERTKDLGSFVMHLSEKKPFEIYDRNYGKNDANYMFPDEYKPFIVGTLAHHEIDKAYKGYKYAINLNSIKQSQTMFARRIFELLSSNTITVSNFSRGVRLLFGDLVFTSDNAKEILKRLDDVTSNELTLKKHRLAALRKVLKEHTYEDRLSYVVSKIQNTPLGQLLPNIAVLAYVKSNKAYDAVLKSFQMQSYAYKKLYVVVLDELTVIESSSENIVILSQKSHKNNTIAQTISENFIAFLSEDDYYGSNYLLDLILSTRYSDEQVIGKACYYELVSDSVVLKNDTKQYKKATLLYARSSMVGKEVIAKENLFESVSHIQTRTFALDSMLSIDEFNYCFGGMDNEKSVSSTVDDLQNLYEGVELQELLKRAESIEPLEELEDNAPFLDAKTLNNLFKSTKSGSVTFTLNENLLSVSSQLEDGKHEYVYAREDFTLEELGYKEKMKFYLDTSLGLNLQLVILFLDAQKQKISHSNKIANINHEADVPLGTKYIRFGLRAYAQGSAEIKSLVLGHRPVVPPQVVGEKEHLVLTNNYPSYEDLYKNAFVHSRVKSYVEKGAKVDVFRLRKGELLSYHEFENVDVVTSGKETLRKMLLKGKYKSVLVHFLDEEMWDVLKDFIDTIPVFVWIHGAEIQPWSRREFLYKSEEEKNDAKKKSDVRMDFWRKILSPMPKNLKLIFVSNYLAYAAFEDLGFELAQDAYTVVHNPIDTEVFTYVQKSPQQRKSILSIRPYASAVYANDLSVATVLLLKEKPFFDELEFRFVGDGLLFDALLEPLRDLKNVTIERRFLTQGEIAQLHRHYGIFLCPSRMDSQGVSRDEAMSSGLVPVTNAVAAIPEFVDEACAILAPAEDAKAMADGIEKLYYDKAFFLELSLNAHKEVAKNRSKKSLVTLELDYIGKSL